MRGRGRGFQSPKGGNRGGGKSSGGGTFLEGKLQHKGRFAFLISEVVGMADAFVSGPSLSLAMDGDRVRVRLGGERNGKRMGEIVEVLTRARTTAIGFLRKAGKAWAVVPEGSDESLALLVLGFAPGAGNPEPGVLVALKIERWPTPTAPAAGTVTKILGKASEPAVRLSATLASKEIDTTFPKSVESEAEKMGLDPTPEQWAGRKELFHLPVFTIDGADAKDFDDAVSLEELPGGSWRLGVHIAAVAEYVKRGSAIDAEAVKRATSVYLPGRVIPMLPPKLSDHLCSLRPDVPRLTVTCWLELDAHGAPGKVEVQETVIRSCRRFTYEEVQDVVDGKPVERVTPEVKAVVLKMATLAKMLTKVRMKRGALDFMTTEYYVKMDEQGLPLIVVKRPRLDSHRLIEEFMVAANEAVARTLSKHKVPFMRRLHETPDPVRLQALQEEMGQLGIVAKTSLVAHPVEGLQSLLAAAVGHPFEETANIQVIRSLKQARYSAEIGGHFGLASKDYCHFTSPIRRYPDLVVHRAVKGLLKGDKTSHVHGLDLEGLAVHCSERERGAAEAERKAVDMARAAILGRSVGQEFDGVVINVTTAGAFVSLPDSGAVGLWRGANATIGQKLKMKLTGVDEAMGRVELEPVKDSLPNQIRVTPWQNKHKPAKPSPWHSKNKRRRR
ncbi:MAG: VacB/RNase II family 3'-5' exoribonuclease [Elusimicrobiota bacterium]